MDRNQAIHAIAALTEPTPDGVLALIRDLASRWPDRALVALAEEKQQQARRRAGIHADDCSSQYPLPTGMGYWHCDCGAAID